MKSSSLLRWHRQIVLSLVVVAGCAGNHPAVAQKDNRTAPTAKASDGAVWWDRTKARTEGMDPPAQVQNGLARHEMHPG